MSDKYIKREDVVNAVANYLQDHRGTSTANHHSDAMTILNCCPSADVVERKRGEWIERKGDAPFNDYEWIEFECSQCRGVQLDKYNFCPNCGADMRKESE